MVLHGDTRLITAPGQFVNLKLEGKYLRRPISVGDYDSSESGSLTLFYDIVGEGTAKMSKMRPGEKIQILMGLGNGFDTHMDCKKPALIGGGIGCAPMLALAKHLNVEGKKPVAFLGFNTRKDVVLFEELTKLGVETIISTVDGTEGVKGFVTDAYNSYCTQHPDEIDYFYACGPMPMLKALSDTMKIDGELSLDERMACGFGICMCCSVRTKDGARRICKDGPIFRKEDLIWK